MKCARCGERDAVVGFLCFECWLEKEGIELPKSVSVRICPKCGRIKAGKRFVPFTLSNLRVIVKEKLEREISKKIPEAKVGVGMEGEDSAICCLELSGQRISFSVRVEFEKELCPECSRRAAGYYEAILQVRGKNMDQKIRELLGFSLVKVEKRKEGVDYYIDSWRTAVKVARKLAKALGGEIKESRKLVGCKDGKRIYRVTVLLRFPES